MLDEQTLRENKAFVDFIIRPKNQKDSAMILSMVVQRIASKSHTVFNKSKNSYMDGLSGHIVRKTYRKEIILEMKEYIKDALGQLNEGAKE